MLGDPLLTCRAEDGFAMPVLVWRALTPLLAISSGVAGGGLGECRWVLNASVPMSYARNDPAAHLREMAACLDLEGPGVGLLTGVDVGDVVAEQEDGVRLWVTVGLGAPIQAAAPAEEPPDHPGTVNFVAWVPQRLSGGALVNAVATITEAKTQAIRDLGLAATGTATDAVCVVCPPGGDVAEYGGPRSYWGAPLARAAHRAMLKRGNATLSWSDRAGLERS